MTVDENLIFDFLKLLIQAFSSFKDRDSATIRPTRVETSDGRNTEH